MSKPKELTPQDLQVIADDLANAVIAEMQQELGYSPEDVARIAGVVAVKVHCAMYNSPGGIEHLRDTIDQCETEYPPMARDSWQGHKKGPKPDID